MQHDPLVCVEGALMASELILQFTQDMTEDDFYADNKTKAAVERKLEVIGEAWNRIKTIDRNMLVKIDNWREIIGFRNVIAHVPTQELQEGSKSVTGKCYLTLSLFA